jgi:arylsulfatase A-like enzyme
VLPRAIRRPLRTLRAWAIAPPAIGAAWTLGVAAWAGSRASFDDDVGDLRKASAVETFVERRFAGELLRMKVGIGATAIALGIALGLAAEVLLRLRDGKRRSPIETVFLVLALHLALLLYAMADTPQLYASSFYAQGGLLRTLQVITTDTLGTKGVVITAALAMLAYVRPRRVVRLLRSNKRPLAIGVAMLIVGALIAIPRRESPPPSQKMNVLILAADSLRADRIDARVAPNLEHLSKTATKFDRAFVSLPRTFPSWVTLLTGRHAHHHGVRSMFPTWEERAKDFDAVPARFGHAGYATSVISDYAGDIFGRIELGFAHVETPSFDFRQLIRQKIIEREIPLLPVLHSHLGRTIFPVMRELAVAADPRLLADDVEDELGALKSRPFMMTVFFSTAHFPYAAPAPYYAKYTDRRYRGRFKYHKPIALSRASDEPPNDEDVRQIRGLYDGAVSAIDDAVGRILRSLDRLGLAERTIVVVTADHGETLFEAGHGQGHGDTLFGDEATHVPLIIYDPRERTPRSIPGVVRDVDLAPTLYDLAGLPIPEGLDGLSVAPAVRGGPLDPRLAFAETELWFTEEIPGLPSELRMAYPGLLALNELDVRHHAEVVLRRDMAETTLVARHRMVRDDRWKLVYAPTRTGVRFLLFDTNSDPEERHDVAAAHPEQVTRLEASLWSWMLEDQAMEKRGDYLVPRRTR